MQNTKDQQRFDVAQKYEVAWWVRHFNTELKPTSRDWLVGYQNHVGRGHFARMKLNDANRFWTNPKPMFPGNSVLDLGSSIVSFFEGAPIECWAVEPSLNALKRELPQFTIIGESRNVTYCPYEIYDIATNRFDSVWTCNMLDHTPDALELLHNEIPRVLKPGGRIYLSVDCRRADVKLDAGHLWKFMPAQLDAELRDSGFSKIWSTERIPDLDYFRYDYIGELR